MLSLIHIPDRGTCDEIRLQLIFVEDRTKNGMKSLASRRSGVKHLQLHIHLKEETKLSLSFGSILPRSQILIPSIILRPHYLGLVGNLDHFTFHGIRFCLSTAGFLFATSFRDLAFSTIRTFVRLVALDGLISQVRFLLSTPKTIAAEMQSWLQLRPQAKLSSTQQSTFFRFTISLSAYWLLVYPSSASKGSESKDICRKQCSQQGFDHENLRYHPSFVPTPSTSRVRRAKTPS